MKFFTIVIVLASFFIRINFCKKIGLMAFALKSHMNELDRVGVELLNRGHEVVYISALPVKNHIKDERYKHINYNIPEEMFSEERQKELMKCVLNGTLTMKLLFNPHFTDVCRITAGNKTFMDHIKAEKFDVFLLDPLPVYKCFFIVAHHSGAPYIGVGTHFMPWNSRFPIVGMYAKERSNFIERLINFALNMMLEFSHFFTLEYDEYSKANGVNFANIEDIADGTKLWLINQEPMLEQPFSIPLHMILVSGLSLKPAMPLDADWEHWASLGPFVLISFGSSVEFQPIWLAKELSECATLLPNLRFAIRIVGKEVELYTSTNVRTTSWLPQSDLLAHPNCLVFVTHCGNNGQQEAIREGVPMVGMPLFGDQLHNAQRLVDRGFGIQLDIKTFRAKKLVSALQKLSQKNATQRILLKRVSNILKSRPNPQKLAADSVEAVLRGDYDLIYPKGAYHLNFFQYHLLDVILSILALFLIVVFVIVLSVVCCYKTIIKCVHRKLKLKTN